MKTDDSGSKTGRMRKALVWSAAEQFGAKAITLLTQIVLARLLLPDEFGILAILLVVVNVADVIAQSGFGQAIIQKSDVSEVTYSTAFWISLAIAAVIYVAVFFLSPAIAAFYNNESIDLYLKIVSLKLLLDSVNSIQRSILQKNMEFKALFRTSFSATLFAGIAGVLCAALGFGIWSLIAQVMLNSFFACIVMAFHLRWLPRLMFNKAEAWELFRFGWKMAATGVLLTLNSGIVELVVGKACSTEMLGYYSQGRKYPAAVMGSVSNALCNVLFPAFAELKADLTEFRAAVSRSLESGTAVIAPATTLLIITAEPLVALLLSEQWLPSVSVFQMACAPYLFILFQVVNLRAYMALGRSDVYLKVHLVKVALGLAIVPSVAIVTQDIYCVAAASALVGTLTIPFVDVMPSRKVYGFSLLDQWKLIAPVYVVCLVSAIPAFLVSLAGLGYALTLMLQILVFAGCYIGIAKVLRINSIMTVLLLVKSMVHERAID